MEGVLMLRLSEKRMNNLLTLSVIGLVDFIIIILYQSGVINSLPDLPWKIFNSDKVNGSPDSYIYGIPDGFIGGSVYLFIILMILIQRNAIHFKTTQALIVLAVVGNAIGAFLYLIDMIFIQQLACIYCICGAVINFISVGVIFPVIKNLYQRIF